MRALWRAAAGDLRGRRLQTFLFLLVVAVAAAGITAGLAQQRSAAQRWDDAFERANGAHIALYGDAAALRRARADAEVVQAAGPSAVTYGTLVHDGSRIDDFEVRAAGPRRPAVGVPLLFGGRWLSGRSTREVVLSRSFALDEGIETGDRVRLRGATGVVDATVVGVALDLVDCFYPECDSQLAWASPAAVERLAPRAADREAVLLARLAHPDAVEAFSARMRATYGEGVGDFEDARDTRADALTLNQFFGAFLASFGVFLLVAAGLVILSTVSSRVLSRYRELGILKAVGFTPRALTLLVLGENLVLAAVGAAVGVLLGGLLAPVVQLRFAEVLERGSATVPAGVLAGAIAVVLAIVALATLLPALRAGRVPASRAIARGAGPVFAHSSRLARAALRLRLGAPAAVGLKDAGARPLRAGLTVATLAVTVVAIVATLALDRTVNQIADDPALVGTPQGIVVAPEDVPPARVARVLDRRPGVESWFTVTERQVAVGDETFQARALGGDLGRTGYVIQDGRMIQGAREAVIGYGLQERLGIGVGDRLALRIAGKALDLRIVGRYAESEDSGERAMITLAGLRGIEPGAAPGDFFLRVGPGVDVSAEAKAIRAAAPGAKVSVEEADLDVFDAFRVAFYVLSLLVLIVGLLNLIATTTLGIRERMVDIGILKTLGFTPRQVAVSIATGTSALALAAVALGIPLGLLAASATMDLTGSGSGIGPEFGTSPSAGAVAVTAAAIVLLAALVGATVARRAARAQVTEVLRAE
jgi:putative ABC transport system permease protein